MPVALSILYYRYIRLDPYWLYTASNRLVSLSPFQEISITPSIFIRSVYRLDYTSPLVEDNYLEVCVGALFAWRFGYYV